MCAILYMIQRFKNMNKEWNLQELQNSVVSAKDINNYYLNNDDAWIFTDTEQSTLISPNDNKEVWRKCKSSDKICRENGIPEYEIYASNRGRIKIKQDKTEIICELCEEEYKDKKTDKYVLDHLVTHHAVKIGYLIVKNPIKNAKTKFFRNEYGYLHAYHLVADAWLTEEYTHGKEIHHITNDGYDNRPENLIILDKDIHDKIPKDGRRDKDYRPGKYDKI